MTVTTVPVSCDIGLVNAAEFTSASLVFTPSGPDYDTASNDTFPAHPVSVELDAAGLGTANLWPVDLGAQNSHYAVTLVGTFVSNGAATSRAYSLGSIRPQSGTTPNLADLLAQSSGGITAGSTIYATLADAVAAAVAAAAAAENSSNQATVAAIAAGAPIVTSLPSPIPANDTVVVLQTASGAVVYQVEGGAWVSQGWLSTPGFDTIAAMAAADGFIDGDYITVNEGDNGEPETFQYVAASALTPDDALVVDAAGMGAGQLVSTRTVYSDYAEAKADSRTFDAGTVLSIRGVTGTLTATDGAGNWNGTNAGGQEFIAWSLIGDVRLWGASGDGAIDDTAAIQSALDAVGNIFVPAGTYLQETITLNGPTRIAGAGDDVVTFRAKSSIGQNNMFYASGVDGIHITGCGFDMQNDVITGDRGNAYLENIFCFVSCKNVHIHNNYFSKAVNYTIIFNAALGAETENVHVWGNRFENGARGAVFSARYGRNIHVYKNSMHNVCNEALSGIAFDKSIAISGVIGCWIEDNYVFQDISGGGTIIVEYQDRQSEDVVISGNRVVGATENSFKVGASVGVKAFGNSSINCGAVGFYIEGCYDFDLSGNFFDGSDANAVRLYEDAQTSRQNKNIRIRGNTFKNSNTGGYTLGVPNGASGVDNSYHIACRQSLDIYIQDNKFVDDGASTSGGIWMQALDRYWIEENDLLQTKSGIVTLYNTATTGTNYNIENNKGMQTTDEGDATIASGTDHIDIVPDTVKEGSSPVIECSLRGPLNGNAAYLFASVTGTATFAVYARTAAHGVPTTASNIAVRWRWSVKDCKGVFGKTAA